ncbi:hypothetical protein K523DRAFT_375747 [Schizophyllum commune Tattone D]|nr:hypothetical protein K523DRAFT_375747 [Schizophyllum commune Tattone D]
MYQSTVFCNCRLCSLKVLHGTAISDRQVSQLLTCCFLRIDAYNPYPILPIPALTRESPCTSFTTGLTAASALNAERIVTRFEVDLELEVHQDAMDASPLHTVLLADHERGVVRIV